MEEFITQNIELYGPLAVFIVLMLSGFGIAVGEEMVTIPAGMFIAQGDMPLGATLIAAYVGIVAADLLWFTICRRYGKPLLHRRWLKRLVHPRRLLQMKHQMEQRGVWFIVMARFIPSSRTTAITVAGMLHMNYLHFALATAGCVLVTLPIQIGLGYLIGRNVTSESMADKLLMVLGVIMVIIALTLVIGWWTRQQRGKKRLPRAKVSFLRKIRRHSAKPKSEAQSSSKPDDAENRPRMSA